MTHGRVMKRPASCGQHCSTGKSSNEKSFFFMTSLQGPVCTVLGKNLPISASMGSIFNFSRKPSGDFMFSNWRMRSAISSRRSTPSAICMRRSEPNWLINTGMPFAPFTFSKSRAGPPGWPYCLAAPLDTRSVISVISRTGSTSALIRLSSPARSSAAIQSRRSLNANRPPLAKNLQRPANDSLTFGVFRRSRGRLRSIKLMGGLIIKVRRGFVRANLRTAALILTKR